MVALLIVATLTLAYVYAGYPLVLRLLVLLRGVRPVRQADITPRLTLIISAYNEAHVMRRKLENALSLTYPRAALEIVVVSDASDDGTDDVVSEFKHRGVRLARQAARKGKTAGLNDTLPTVSGDIVVFSDANAIYQPDALLKLARNFADPEVGCVTGEARYVAGGSSAADVGERAYWDYEIQIKRLETALGSMVGGDGAIYAIRRTLWRRLPENAINDFLNPLQIVAAGWRAVYEPDAICYEETAGGIGREYRRRVRIVSRSWRAVFQAPGVLNPRRVGLFTWSLVSHKMLRWLSGLFASVAVLAGLVELERAIEVEPILTLSVMGACMALLVLTRWGQHLVAMVVYVMTIYAASGIGVVKGSLGQVSGVWSTSRQVEAPQAKAPRVIAVGMLMQGAIGLAVAWTIVLVFTVSLSQVAAMLFWVSAGIVTYVYIGYPALLYLMRYVAGSKVQRAPIEPTVCVFITANDEEDVIEEKLQNTLALDYPRDRLSVVVASDGSVDATNDIVRRYAPAVRLLELSPRRGKMTAINLGIKNVTGDVIVFSDANTFLQPGAIRALTQNFADPQVGAVSGDVTLIGERASLGRSEDLYYRYERWVQRAESEIGSMIGADGALYAIRRELFTPPGADTILDDMAIPMAVVRAGYRVVYEGTARALEQGSETAREEFARKMRVIAGAVQFIRRRDSAVPASAPQVIVSLVSHKALRWLSPLFAIAIFVSSLLLAGTSQA
jgi:cellulose synthase/poly-beta-1,6-N-acetylglucosamine synthase-like glycosyltransferase